MNRARALLEWLRRPRHPLRFLFISIGLMALLSPFVPISKRSLYVSVKRGEQVSESGKADDFFVKNGDLFLRIQTTRPSLLLVTWVERVEWDANALGKLLQQHPELSNYIDQPSLGSPFTSAPHQTSNAP